MRWLIDKWRNQHGQGLTEYALILLLVAVAVVVTVALFGTTLAAFYNNIATLLP